MLLIYWSIIFVIPFYLSFWLVCYRSVLCHFSELYIFKLTDLLSSDLNTTSHMAKDIYTSMLTFLTSQPLWFFYHTFYFAICDKLCNIFLICYIGVWTQGLMLAIQTFYHLSHTLSPTSLLYCKFSPLWKKLRACIYFTHSYSFLVFFVY
jgi:hypothetical protein